MPKRILFLSRPVIRLFVTACAFLFIFNSFPLYASASTTDCYKYIMPLKFDDIEIGTKYIYYSKGGRWGRAELDGTIQESETFATLQEAKNKAVVITKPLYSPYKAENGLFGYKNSSGDIVIPAKYDAVANTFENNAAIVQYKGKYGIISTSGEVLYDFICDTLYKSDVNNFYAYTINEKTGFIDNKFKKLTEPFLRSIFVYMYDGYVVYQAAGSKYGLASYDGRVLCGAIWDYMRDFCEGLAAVGVNEDFYGINVRWGWIDTKGNTVIPAVYNSVNDDSLDFSEGLAGVCEGSNGYYIDKTGRTVIELPVDTYPYTNFSNNLAVVTKNLEKKYINKNGEVILQAALGVKWYRAGNFNGDIAVVSSYFDTFTEGYTGVIRYLCNTPSAWALSEITAAKKVNLVPDDLAGQYTVPITRTEYCRLAMKLIEVYSGKSITDIVKTVNKNIFTDTADMNVLYAQALGIVDGRGGGIFDPKGKINRQEAAKILVNTYKSCTFIQVHSKPMPSYGDKANIDSWANEGIWYMGEWGVMIGIGNNLFAPKNDYTREQSIMTMIRLYNLLLENRPQTLFISPSVTVMDGSKTDKYAADPEFFMKIILPSGWHYNDKTGVFTTRENKTAAVLSNLTVYPGGPPENKTDENAGIYYFTIGNNLQLKLSFNADVNSADVKRIYSSIVLYDRKTPVITEDLDSYMYDVSRRAAEAIGWFEMNTMTARSGLSDIIERYNQNTHSETSTKAASEDGYTEIGDSRIKTYAELEAYLKTLFSDEIADRLLALGMYRDINGRLCGLDAARGSDITKGGSAAAIKRLSDSKISYTVTVELLSEDLKSVAGFETHGFTYELIGPKWVWTKFYLYV